MRLRILYSQRIWETNSHAKYLHSSIQCLVYSHSLQGLLLLNLKVQGLMFLFEKLGARWSCPQIQVFLYGELLCISEWLYFYSFPFLNETSKVFWLTVVNT